jgi:serine/threonine protein phosphatase 1
LAPLLASLFRRNAPQAKSSRPPDREGLKRPAAVPEGLRVYAIGDVHGRADLLGAVLDRIDAHHAGRPPARKLEILLGDYVDRGPKSRDVLDVILSRQAVSDLVCLRGNHDEMPLRFLREPAFLSQWSELGGVETLLSYGVSVGRGRSADAVAADFGSVLPAEHRAFLDALPFSHCCGDYFFVHAGVRPGTPLDGQNEHDLIWIRDEFLDHAGFFEKKIVHGHTPKRSPENLPNRMNLDTGAYITGVLTCAVFEGDRVGFV